MDEKQLSPTGQDPRCAGASVPDSPILLGRRRHRTRLFHERALCALQRQLGFRSREAITYSRTVIASTFCISRPLMSCLLSETLFHPQGRTSAEATRFCWLPGSFGVLFGPESSGTACLVELLIQSFNHWISLQRILPTLFPICLRLMYDAQYILDQRCSLPGHHISSLKTIRTLIYRHMERFFTAFPSFDYMEYKVALL